MQALKISLVALLLVRCDSVDAPDVAPRGEDIYGPGCEYTWPINWNENNDDTPAEVVMKSALCLDALVQHCDDNPEGCLVTWHHCVDTYGPRLKAAL